MKSFLEQLLKNRFCIDHNMQTAVAFSMAVRQHKCNCVHNVLVRLVSRLLLCLLTSTVTSDLTAHHFAFIEISPLLRFADH